MSGSGPGGGATPYAEDQGTCPHPQEAVAVTLRDGQPFARRCLRCGRLLPGSTR